jgi:hypothetical protein
MDFPLRDTTVSVERFAEKVSPAKAGIAEPAVSPLPTSPARGEVPHRVFGAIVPETPAGTLPLAGRVGGPLAVTTQ